jgi:DNA helicase-2/ATP-dependent DNA helicase PcrA
VVRLEQNYRSTQTILDSAQKIIAVNPHRNDMNLWTDKGAGDPIVVYEAYNEEQEAAFVAQEVKRLRRDSGAHLGDIAVMYRVNAQSRAIEERFVAERLPYRLVGGTRFYERREIKDLLAYLRLILNPFDSIGLDRVLNVPPRRIGEKTQQELQNWAKSLEVPVYTALQLLGGVVQNGQSGNGAIGHDNGSAHPDEAPAGPDALAEPAGGSFAAFLASAAAKAEPVASPFAQPARTSLVGFLTLLNELIAKAPVLTVSQLLSLVIDKTRYREYLVDAFPVDGEERWENVMELRNVAAQFDELEPEHALMRFLEDVALMSDTDDYDEKIDAVTLISLHSAKGLEFPVVFIIGMEEGILPHIRSFDDPHQMEEERRLAYVGVTRAKDRLYLLRAFRRSLMGAGGHNPSSRFLKDLPPELVHQAAQDVEQAYRRPMRQSSWSTSGPTATREAVGQAAPRALATYSAGDHVRHAKFGEGIVIMAASTANGADQEVTVAFKGESGVKKLLLSFAPLEKLD